jgi:hypothetical protein
LESQVGQGSGSTFHVYLPLPSLNGQPVLIPAAKPVLLMISSRRRSPASVSGLHLHGGWETRHIRPGDDLEQVLVEAQPVAWPGTGATRPAIKADSFGTSRFQLPFILFDQNR